MTFLPLVIAHRGASGYRPEHTRAAFELAFEQGADAVEPDLVATRDGVLVIRHENEISGTTDVASRPEFENRRRLQVIDGQQLIGWFTEDFTWAELSTLRARERLPKIRPSSIAYADESILRFSDLLTMLDVAPPSALGAPIGLVAEIKHATYFESIGLPLDVLLAAELRAAGWDAEERLTVECFELTVLQKVRASGIRARLVFLLEAGVSPADAVAALGAGAPTADSFLTEEGLAALAASVDGISFDKRILLKTDAAGHPVGRDLVMRAHAAGLTVFCWTLRAENKFLARSLRRPGRQFGVWQSEFVMLMEFGVDGVFADQPDLAILTRRALSSHGETRQDFSAMTPE